MPSDLKEAILPRLEKLEGPDRNGEYTALCPFAPERNHRLSVNFETDVYDCPHCYSHGPASRLAQVLGVHGLTSPNRKEEKPPAMAARLSGDPKKMLCHSHQEMLRAGSGISDEVIAERGYRTISARQGQEYGFGPSQCRSGLLLPVWAPDGTNPLHVLRPDKPREGEGGKALKYEMPRGQSVRLDCPPRCKSRVADPNIPLWITEGIKKSDALATHGLCAIALLGVWNF